MIKDLHADLVSPWLSTNMGPLTSRVEVADIPVRFNLAPDDLPRQVEHGNILTTVHADGDKACRLPVRR